MEGAIAFEPVVSSLVPYQADPWEEKAEALTEATLSGKSERTEEAYRAGWKDFQAFIGASTLGSLVKLLFTRGPGGASFLLLKYRKALMDRGLAAKTVNLRLCSIRALVRTARKLGWIDWTVDVEDIQAQSYLDTRGPGLEGVRKLLGAAEGQGGVKGLRDQAIVRLLFDMGLRRAEAIGLDMEDLDLEGDRIAILGKGRSQKEWLTLPEPTKEALAAWVEVRGDRPGAVFPNLDRAGKGNCRISLRSVTRLISELGAEVGIRATPHGLRHTSITTVLDLNGGNVRAAQKFSRHKSLSILTIYDDNRADLGGEMARLVASSL